MKNILKFIEDKLRLLIKNDPERVKRKFQNGVSY